MAARIARSAVVYERVDLVDAQYSIKEVELA
jgi:hypothetical protein